MCNQLVVGSSPTRPTIFTLLRCLSPPAVNRIPVPACAVVLYTEKPATVANSKTPLVFRLRASSCARVAELADALDLGSSGVTRAGSSPAFRTSHRVRPDYPLRTAHNGAAGWFADLITINSLEV